MQLAEAHRVALALHDAVHRERARTNEPALVAGATEELEKRVAVAAGAVAEVGALDERTGVPGRLAAGEQKSVERRSWHR